MASSSGIPLSSADYESTVPSCFPDRPHLLTLPREVRDLIYYHAIARIHYHIASREPKSLAFEKPAAGTKPWYYLRGIKAWAQSQLELSSQPGKPWTSVIPCQTALALCRSLNAVESLADLRTFTPGWQQFDLYARSLIGEVDDIVDRGDRFFEEGHETDRARVGDAGRSAQVPEDRDEFEHRSVGPFEAQKPNEVDAAVTKLYKVQMLPRDHPHPDITVQRAAHASSMYPDTNTNTSKQLMIPLRGWWTACRQLHDEVQPSLPSYLSSAHFSFGTDHGLWAYITALPPIVCSNITAIHIRDTTQGESVLNHVLRNEKLSPSKRLTQLRECHILLRRYSSATALQYLQDKTTVRRHRSAIRQEIAIRASTVERLGKGLALQGVKLVAHDIEGESTGWREWLKEQNEFMARMR